MAPSTFLRTIADQISSMMAPRSPTLPMPSYDGGDRRRPGPRESSAFEIAVSLSSADASLASGKAQKWLKDKFSIPGGAKEYRRDGMSFRVSIQQGAEPASADQRDVGLVVFELPAQSHDLRSVRKDAEDRMRALERLADSSSCRYNAALLLITWTREETSEVMDRVSLLCPSTVEATLTGVARNRIGHEQARICGSVQPRRCGRPGRAPCVDSVGLLALAL